MESAAMPFKFQLADVIAHLTTCTAGKKRYLFSVSETYCTETLENPAGKGRFEVMFPREPNLNTAFRSQKTIDLSKAFEAFNRQEYVAYGRTSRIMLKMDPRHPGQLTIFDRKVIPFLHREFILDILELMSDDHFKSGDIIMTFNAMGSGASTPHHIHFQTERQLPVVRTLLSRMRATCKATGYVETDDPIYGVLFVGPTSTLTDRILSIIGGHSPASIGTVEGALPANLFISSGSGGKHCVVMVPRVGEYGGGMANPVASCEVGGKFVLARNEDFVPDYHHYLRILREVTYSPEQAVGFRQALLLKRDRAES